MIAFYPIISTVKDHTSFFEVSTILIVYFFSRCLESISDFFFLLLIGCSGSLSMGAFLSRQARSQFFFFLRGGAIQRGDRDQMRPKGQLSRRGKALVVWDWIARQVAIGGGGAHFECVSVSQLGVFGGMLPWKMFKFKPSEMAKTNMVLWKLYAFNIKKKNVAIRKLFSTKSCVALIGVLISSKQHKELSPARQSWREFSFSPTVKVTIQIQHFAENYGKQTPEGNFIEQWKNVLYAQQIPLLYCIKAKTRLWKGWVRLVTSFTAFSILLHK